MGISVPLAGAIETCSWVGNGPALSYVDMEAGTRLGKFESSLCDLWEMTVVPQESGNRENLRELNLFKGGGTVSLKVLEGDVSFSVVPAHVSELDRNGHWHEVELGDQKSLILDLTHHGLGSRSCGPDVRPMSFGNNVATKCLMLLDFSVS